MHKKSMFTIVCLFIINVCFSQLSKDKTSELSNLLERLFYGARSNAVVEANSRLDAPSEAIFCVFEIDSSGMVGGIHLLADEKNKDSAFIILKQLTPDDFHSWKDDTYIGKVIVIPFVLMNFNDRSSNSQYALSMTPMKLGGPPQKIRNGVMLPTIVASWPRIIFDIAPSAKKAK